MALLLDTDLLRLLVSSKQFSFATVGHPLSNLARTLGPAVGNYQQSEALGDLRRPSRPSLFQATQRVGQIMADPSQDDVSITTEPKTGQPRARPAHSRAEFRASLACRYCRNKHVKCDGYIPQCTRCKTEGKPCGYDASRRGIRDPKKRKTMKDEALATSQDVITDDTPSPNFTGFDIPIPYFNSHPAGWKPEVRSPGLRNYLFDLYYANFHATHSWLPPKNTLIRLLETERNALEFLVAAILYIGSLYSDIDSTALRKRAQELSSGSFPSTVWSVQALLSISIAAFGEQHHDISATRLDGAHNLACQLGLQHRSFAEGEKDPVLAESFRRTYWALYIHGSLQALRENSGHSQLYSIRASTELPCEEWDYQAGEIPTPVTLEEYDRMGRSREYSSWAYFVDLLRTCGDHVVPLLSPWSQGNLDDLERADSNIESWRFQLRNWRRDHVDSDGMGDMILYHALGVSYGLQIRLQLHAKGIGPRFGLGEVADSGQFCLYASTRPSHGVAMGPDSWVHRSPLQNPLRLISLLNSHLPPEKFSPSCIMDLERVAVPLVDTLLHKEGPPIYKDKLLFLAKFLKKSGETWFKSEVVSDEIFNALGKADAENIYTAQSQAMTTMTGAVEPTVPGGEDSLWFMPSTIGSMGGWSELTTRSMRDEVMTTEVMSWSGMTSQTLGPDMMGASMATGLGGSFSHFKNEAGGIDDGSGISS